MNPGGTVYNLLPQDLHVVRSKSLKFTRISGQKDRVPERMACRLHFLGGHTQIDQGLERRK